VSIGKLAPLALIFVGFKVNDLITSVNYFHTPSLIKSVFGNSHIASLMSTISFLIFARVQAIVVQNSLSVSTRISIIIPIFIQKHRYFARVKIALFVV
jgi:ABC-type transport system involved in multi-copper enzyme maturation permease subunit